MAFFFVCHPEADYEMFHEEPVKQFESNIIEAVDANAAIIKYWGGIPDNYILIFCH